MADTPIFILDSFALLVYFTEEPGAEKIENILRSAQDEQCELILPLMNLGEIMYITERRGGPEKAQETLALIRQLPLEIHPANEQAVLDAAHIKANYPLSYADAFIVATAQFHDGTILTGDPEFKNVEEIVSIDWIGK